jgi:flavin reductase (DIM6/NTAB) family NADH-FMN oxidoreductase RutF
MITVDPTQIEQPKLHQYLLGSIGPRPIAFVSTIDEDGNDNLAPYSFFNVFSSNPPVLIVSPARRGRDKTTKHTLENARIQKQCVVNIVDYAMVQQMSLSSTEYPAGVSEFVKAGLTPIASEIVKPQRVMEAPVQMECEVFEIIPLGDGGGAGNLMLCKVVRIHMHEHIFDGDGRIDPVRIDQVARMGGHWYTRANAGLFQLPQPTTTIGIGFDQLPEDIRRSAVLTGNELAQLAGVESLPDETSVNEFKLLELADVFLDHQDNAAELERVLHQMAKLKLGEKDVEGAWKTLLAFNN